MIQRTFTKDLNAMRALVITFSMLASISFSYAGTSIDNIKKRDYLSCGINNHTPGFNLPDKDGKNVGMSPDLCRAFAAGILGDFNKARLIPQVLNVSEIPNLQVGNIDLLSKSHENTLVKSSTLGIRYVATWFIDDQKIAVKSSAKIEKPKDLEGATFCVTQGNNTESNLVSWSKVKDINYKVVTFSDFRDSMDAFFEGRCDALTMDGHLLVSNIHYRDTDNKVKILDWPVVNKSYSFAVAAGNEDLEHAIRWVWNWLLKAEEMGINSKNIDEKIKNLQDPKLRFILDPSNPLWIKLGLDSNWAYNVIKQVGNYGELYDKHFTSSIIQFPPRGANRLLKDGGTMVPLSFN